MFLLFLTVVFILSVIGTGVVRDYALANRIMDVASDRSSHIEPTPRGGGLSIIVVFFAASAVWFIWDGSAGLAVGDAVVITLLATMIAFVGWLDDHRPVSSGLRFMIHLFAAFAAIAYFGVPQVPLGTWTIDLGWLGWPLAVLAMAWCLNFFNFMDGIDGIAAVEAVTMAIGAWLVLAMVAPGYTLLPYLWLLAVVSGGFLVWNWAPARIFMGDAASVFLGFLLALFALVTSNDSAAGGVNVWCWLILFGVFFIDATLTLILRVVAREKLPRAHRHHAYQRLARALQKAEGVVLSPQRARANAHRTISLAVGVLNLLWLTPLALAAALWPGWGILFALIALTPLALAVLFVAAHTTPARRFL